MTIPLFAERLPSAVFSDCSTHGASCADPACFGRLYRYLLRWPTGVDNNRIALGIFANPSTATAEKLDPTLTRWVNYCRAWGYGWAYVANARAWRATDPKDVPPDPMAIGPDNERHIVSALLQADLVVCGWGKLGGVAGARVIDLVAAHGKTPHALKLNQDGSPAHPLYLSSKLRPVPMVSRGPGEHEAISVLCGACRECAHFVEDVDPFTPESCTADDCDEELSSWGPKS